MPQCTRCSAPLPEASPTCEYCGAVNDVDLRRVSAYTESAPPGARECPDCGQRMASVDVSAQSDARFVVERCEKCLGLFFDTGELEALLEAAVSHANNIDFTRLGFMGATPLLDQVKYRKCPDCGKIMNRVNFGARSGVITDQCGHHGVWLQPGELSRILDWRKSGGALYHEQVKREKELAAKKVEEEQQERLRQLLREAAAYGHE